MVQTADEALEGLREHVTLILMHKLTETLNTTGAVQWMPNVRITHEGIYYRPKGFVSRKEEQFLSFADVTAFNVEEGTFHVWKKGADKSVIQEATSEPNFYPGYLLLTTMYWAHRKETAEEA
jgi:hypothetical protein